MATKKQLEKIEAEEKKYQRWLIQGRRCFVCKKTTPYDEMQIAHRVPKGYVSIYGPEVIHHKDNTALVCSRNFGRCNDSVLLNMSSRPLEAKALIESIKKKLGGHSGD